MKNLSLINTYNLVFKALTRQQKLWVPFVIFMFTELVILMLLYVAPRQPFNVVLAPPIRAFWGERFLHYPANFLLLPKLGSLIRNYLTVFLGSFLTGTAVVLFAEAFQERKVKLIAGFKAGFKKYFSLLIVISLITAILFSLVKVLEIGLIRYFTSGHKTLLFLKPQIWMGPLLIAINLVLVVLVQGIFVYAIPLIMLNNVKLFSALLRSPVVFIKLFRSTIALIALPLLFYIPIIVLQVKTVFLIDRIFPESVLYVCIAGIVISALVVDLLITFSTTALFLQNQEKI